MRGRACVHVALLIQHSTHTRHIVTSFVVPLAAPYFRRCYIKGMIFEKKEQGKDGTRTQMKEGTVEDRGDRRSETGGQVEKESEETKEKGEWMQKR